MASNSMLIGRDGHVTLALISCYLFEYGCVYTELDEVYSFLQMWSLFLWHSKQELTHGWMGVHLALFPSHPPARAIIYYFVFFLSRPLSLLGSPSHGVTYCTKPSQVRFIYYVYWHLTILYCHSVWWGCCGSQCVGSHGWYCISRLPATGRLPVLLGTQPPYTMQSWVLNNWAPAKIAISWVDVSWIEGIEVQESWNYIGTSQMALQVILCH